MFLSVVFTLSIAYLNQKGSEVLCTIKIFMGGGGGAAGMVDGEGSNSERCLKWGGGGSSRNLSKNIQK